MNELGRAGNEREVGGSKGATEKDGLKRLKWAKRPSYVQGDGVVDLRREICSDAMGLFVSRRLGRW